MNARQRSDDEASFENLVSFDTAPPPKGTSADGDVHSACTAVAELPDSFLEALKSGVKADVTRLGLRSLAAAPRIAREEPEDRPASEIATTGCADAFELPEPPTSPYGAKLLSPDSAEELAPLPEPYAPAPSYRPSRGPERISFEVPAPPPPELPRVCEASPLSTPPPVTMAEPPAVRPSFVARLRSYRRSLGLRHVLLGAAVVVTSGVFLALWMLLLARIS